MVSSFGVGVCRFEGREDACSSDSAGGRFNSSAVDLVLTGEEAAPLEVLAVTLLKGFSDGIAGGVVVLVMLIFGFGF